METSRESVEVYSFRIPEPTIELSRHAPFKATREAIERLFGGEVLEGTAERVDLDELDEQGRFRRVATGWGDLDG